MGREEGRRWAEAQDAYIADREMVKVEGFVGVEHQDPVAAGAREARVAGVREVVPPRFVVDRRTGGPRDVDRRVRRAGVDEDDLVDDARDAREAPRQVPRLVPGAVRALLQKPQDRPVRPKKSPAPLFHAFTKTTRRALWEAYSWFVAAFREAAEKLKTGDRMVIFPVGSFPPHLPFVSEAG